MSALTPKAKNVVFMADFQTDTRFAACAQVEAYWEAARDGRDMPSRYEVDPRGMADALSVSFIAETLAPRVAKLRIAGSGLNDLLGMEVRGMPLTSFFSATGRPVVSRAIEHALSEPSVQTLYLSAETGIGKPKLEAKLLLLPLKTESGARTRLLGVLEPKGMIGRTPRRFDVCRIGERRITAAAEPSQVTSQQNQFAENPATFVARGDISGARSHLRLVQSIND